MIHSLSLGEELFRATLEELMSGRLSVAPLVSEWIGLYGLRTDTIKSG